MPFARCAALTAIITLAACSATDPTQKTPVDDDEVAVNNETTGAHDADMGDEARDVSEPADVRQPADLGDVPASITSAGAQFAGVLGAGESIDVDLTVFQADRVTMWLRQDGSTSWDPSINVYAAGESDPLVWGNPQGDEDASIPYLSDELADGFEFWFTGTYRLQLENRGDADGAFLFTLECRGGPCAIDSGDADVDGEPDETDACAYRPGSCDDPYPGLSDAELEDAIRADHADHVVMNYVEARVHMFAWIDNSTGEVEGIYTGDRVATEEIPDPEQMNTEHGWPQSRSGGNEDSRSDLHHLFPTKPDANAERASLYFGEVVDPDWQRGGSARGRNDADDTVFEPRDRYKGDLARALFYHAVIYDVEMRAEEEVVLRRWNGEDPPDEHELRRHQSIANVQRSRNPFVDHSSLVDRISSF